ncbi:Hypp375 [Branchiostoma lanceolatum]|uniref:Hypp375 protein n=1 Tax=Branchiostoma lanceolatum TaxID=7740 RepID=A0A8J9YKK5_BRALA|nr:Hypp375 [Branchiostoma lanceolatum]
MEGLIHAQDIRIPPAAVLHHARTEDLAASFPAIDRLLQGTGLTLDIIKIRLMIATLEGTRPERVVSAAQIISMYRYDTAEVLLFMSAMLCSIPLRNFGRCYHELQRASIESMAFNDAINASGDSNSRMEKLVEEEGEGEKKKSNGKKSHGKMRNRKMMMRKMSGRCRRKQTGQVD